MNAKNILRAFLIAVFVLGTLAMNAQIKIYVYKSNGTTDGYNIADLDSISFVAPAAEEEYDYTKLILTEISGEHKFIEIYNSGAKPISMKGVKLVRNDGQSSWPTAESNDIIPAGAYRLFLFNSYTAGLDTNPAFVGWTVGSGISDQQTLKIAILDPDGVEVSVFIRGDETVMLPWQTTSGVTRNRNQSYSLMGDGTWAYADPTPGEENGPKVSEIVSPGYLTATP